jgi:hypothetical protein
MRLWGFVAACICIVVGSSRADAQSSGIRAGELVCSGGPSIGLIVGSTQNLRCTFRSFQNGRRYSYSGTMRRIGLDIGVTARSRLLWIVFSARSTRVKRGTLAGSYTGASGDASFGFGAGANVLIGGFRRSISLQPLSIQGQAGVNLAIGVSSMTLR